MGSVVSRESVPRKSVWRRSVSVRSVSRAVRWAVPSRRRRVRQRLGALVGAVDGVDVSGMSVEELLGRVDRYLCDPTPAKMWITLAVLTADYPLAENVLESTRLSRLDGSGAVLMLAIFPKWFHRLSPVKKSVPVEVVRDQVIVDVDHTSTVDFATGIQRVVRETVKRWVRDHDPILVGWTPEKTGLRRLDPAARRTALTGAKTIAARSRRRSEALAGSFIVPMGGSYILPELTLDRRVTMRLASLGETSGTECAAIGFDAVPLSSSETVDFMVSGGFANNLSAVKYMRRVVTISESAAQEYRGWRTMLKSAGLDGPDIRACLLPHESPAPRTESMPDVEALGAIPGMPLVLCVGSHEPRKNHLAVLQAAEGLWREGLRFQLLFVGGNGWSGGLFAAKVAELIDNGRPIASVTALRDDLLSAAYQLADFTVFPSLNEGYGLPVVESLVAGTPVLTSDFGSMLEISRTGGALYVDPRDDDAIMDGMRRLLVDPELRARLAEECRRLPPRSWDEYATETWDYLVST